MSKHHLFVDDKLVVLDIGEFFNYDPPLGTYAYVPDFSVRPTMTWIRYLQPHWPKNTRPKGVQVWFELPPKPQWFPVKVEEVPKEYRMKLLLVT